MSELDTQIEIASKLGFIATNEKASLESKLDSIAKKLACLINKVRKDITDSER